LAELAFAADALGVGLEVALQVRPADLATRERQVVVGPPAIGRDDRRGVGEQVAGVILTAVRGDGEYRVAVREGAPERVLGSLQPPPRLVHVQVAGGAHAVQQIGVGVAQRVADPREDRVDGPSGDPGAEQLLAQLDDVAARDPVAHRQHRDRRLVVARPERAVADPGGQLAARASAAARAAHALAAMLAHRDSDRRQLLDLMTRREAIGNQLDFARDVATATTRRPVVDELVYRPRRQQRPALALMTGLGALLAPRRILARWPGCSAAGSLRSSVGLAPAGPSQATTANSSANVSR
jgi:hypothetical protein